LHEELDAVKRASSLVADAAGKSNLVRGEWLAFLAARLTKHQETESAIAGTQGY